MKNNTVFVIIGAIFLLVTLACGQSIGVSVATPTASGGLTVEQVVATSMAALTPDASISTAVPQATAMPEPTVTLTTAPLGSARSNPAPVGSAITADDIEFSVISIIRPANQQVADGNMFNETPSPSKEYMMVEIKAFCTKTADEKCSLSTYNFKLLNSSGIMSDFAFVAGVAGELVSTEFFGGASMTGFLPFMVDQGGEPLLVYSPLFDINNAEFYLALQ